MDKQLSAKRLESEDSNRDNTSSSRVRRLSSSSPETNESEPAVKRSRRQMPIHSLPDESPKQSFARDDPRSSSSKFNEFQPKPVSSQPPRPKYSRVSVPPPPPPPPRPDINLSRSAYPPPGIKPPNPPGLVKNSPSGLSGASNLPPCRALAEARRKWLLDQRRRYSDEICKSSIKFTRVLAKKPVMPPQHLRKIIQANAELRHVTGDNRVHVGALKYLPHALLKLLENMPQPWEPVRVVRVLYHVAGAVTFVDESPRVIEPVYRAQWASVWKAMQSESRDRTRFRRVEPPLLDDEEQPIDWSENLEEVSPPPSIRMESGGQEFWDWIYENRPLVQDSNVVNGPSYRRWSLDLHTMAQLMLLSGDFIPSQAPCFLFDMAAFVTAKALNVAVPQGPKFEPLYRDYVNNPELDDFTDFNSIDRVIFRRGIVTELQVAYPFLYNDFVKSVRMGGYQKPLPSAVSISSDSSMFEFVATMHLLPQRNVEGKSPGSMRVHARPWLTLEPVEPSGLKEALSLYNAPYPFNLRYGATKRAQDVALVKGWYTTRTGSGGKSMRAVSHQKLLRNLVLNDLKSQQSRRPQARRQPSVVHKLKQTRYFQQTSIDWVEAGIQVCRQGHHMLNLLIHRKGLTFLHLDYNFNLKPTKTLTTKERKRSRFGHAFHLIRELLRVVKLVVDCHVEYRLGHIDAYQLADALFYLLNDLGKLTGIYRYKYKVMHQIRQCKDLRCVIQQRFSSSVDPEQPGCGCWQPAWRVWVFFMRGIVPLLERWLGNMINRQFEGRRANDMVKTVTKQRVDAYYDLELRTQVMHDILEIMPPQIQQKKSRVLLQHLSEAWRCWKANVPWKVPGLPKPVEKIILRYIEAKANGWVEMTHYNRERLRRGISMEKTMAKKNLGRLTRLHVKAEQQRQMDHGKGHGVQSEEAIKLFRSMVEWLQSRQFSAIPFPPLSYKHDTKVLLLALEGLKEGYSADARLNSSQREELALIEQAYDNPHETLARIRKLLLTQRIFKEVGLHMMDYYTHLVPTYTVDPLEKITDAYLDQYLWLEAESRRLFPSWIKPSDDEIPPILLYKWCQGVNNVSNVWDTDHGECNVMVESQLTDLMANVDLLVLNRLLRLIVDPNIADYMTAKNNVSVNYKDMNHVNCVGVLKGLKFASFVHQFYGLCVDLLLLGHEKASELAGPPASPAPFMSVLNSRGPIKLYMRWMDKVYVFLRFDHEESVELIEDYRRAHLNEGNTMKGYNNKKCWSRDARMRLLRHDVMLGRAVHWELARRLPDSVTSIPWSETMCSVYSVDNPNLLFQMVGFEVRILPLVRQGDMYFEGSDREGAWSLVDTTTKLRTAVAYLQVSSAEIDKFVSRVRQILMSSGSSTFTKVGGKWNTAVIALFTYFREAVVGTPALLDALVRCETKIQNRVKMGLNSKMPTRFPPCVFYTPKELGGLGMVSASHILVPISDLKWSKQSDSGVITHFRAGMTSQSDASVIPTIFRYITTWEDEFADSQRVWAEFVIKKQVAHESNRKLTFEDMEHSWDRGIPRISTLFAKDRHTLSYDKGHRIRKIYKQYSDSRMDQFWWTNYSHDGRLWNLQSYRTDMIEALGGIDTILEHTLFKSTGFASWEGLFWEKSQGFEDSLKFKKLTNAQRSGLSQIPNRRFTLWWSPTINRANVYVGFLVQLDLTGIFLHGKIPTLKISLIQIFRAHLWQKIHESVVSDLCQVFDKELDALGIASVEKESIHPRKSYKMTSSAADISLKSVYPWSITGPSLLGETNDSNDGGSTTNSWWIDVQLRFGDFDSHDISRYARAKFLDYTSDNVSNYPSPFGVVIAIDLAYNLYDAYGNWPPGAKALIANAMREIMRSNPALFVLRERIRKGLSLYQSQPRETQLSSSNYQELFTPSSKLVVDDSNVYRVAVHKTSEGNMATTPINGSLFMANPLTGQLYLKIIHHSVWAGHKRLGQLAKWKTAEEITALLRSLPKEEQPSSIILTRRGVLDALESSTLDFPNLSVRTSELRLPFGSLLKVPKLADFVESSKRPEMVLMNLYDDWLTQISPYTAFSRIVLLFRSFATNADRAEAIIFRSEVRTFNHHLWPSYDTEEWISVEAQLRDLILADYTKKYGITVSQLTQSEVRDLILGQEIRAPSDNRELAANLEEGKEEKANAAVTATKSFTTNLHGEKIVTITTSNYESSNFSSQNEWRSRMMASNALHLRSKNIFLANSINPSNDSMIFVVPRSLLKTFISICDTRVQVAAYLFGESPTDNPRVKEIKYLALVPQLGNTKEVKLPEAIPSLDSNPDLRHLELLGWIHTQTVGPSSSPGAISTDFLRFMGGMLGNESHHSLLHLVLAFTPGAIRLEGYHLRSSGLEWGKAYGAHSFSGETGTSSTDDLITPAQVVLTDQIAGAFLVPQNKFWNFYFMGSLWEPSRAFKMRVDSPWAFYEDEHRPLHFLQLSQANDS
ncbi:pre-mRNA-splicing factor 8 [Diutina catenulata]